MIDFGIVTAFRKQLIGDVSLQEEGYQDKIHTCLPNGTALPYVLIEIEEIWTSMRMGAGSSFAKLKLKASTFSESIASREPLKIAEKIRHAMDGRTLDTSDGRRAMVRLSGSVIDMPSIERPLLVQQYFEVLIRG